MDLGRKSRLEESLDTITESYKDREHSCLMKTGCRVVSLNGPHLLDDAPPRPSPRSWLDTPPAEA